MALNTQLIAPIGKDFEFPQGQDSLGAFFGGVTSGYASAQAGNERRATEKQIKSDYTSMFGKGPSRDELNEQLKSRGIQPGNYLTDFARGYQGIPASRKALGDPMFGLNAEHQSLENQQLQQTNTLRDQLSKNAGDIVHQFGNLSDTESRLKFLQDHAGISLTPEGQHLFSTLTNITAGLGKVEAATALGQAKIRDAKHAADLMEYGFRLDQPDTRPTAEKNFQLNKVILPLADKMGVLPNDIPSDWFDASGIADLSKVMTGLATMPKQNFSPVDFTNIKPTPMLDDKGDVIAFGLPNGRGGIHYVTPGQGGQVTFGVAPNGQRYVTTGKGIHLLHDIEHEAKVKVAVTGLNDVNQRIRDLESSTRLKPEERTKRLDPLLKQKSILESTLKAALPSSDPSPAITPSTEVSPAFEVPVAAPGEPIFKTRDAVKGAFNAGKLSKEEAITILNEQFGLPK
jgi:hypothetical protein